MTSRDRWPLSVVLTLAPLWFAAILYRGLWTPDEPREADIAWRMSIQSDRTLPQLAEQPFLEKPPLTYWASGASLRLFGDTPAAARTPNLLYALVTSLGVGTLGFAMAGADVALLAALSVGTLLIALRVTVWLAPDAGLLAGCTISLLGAYLGYCAGESRRKLLGYTLMHVGAAMGFMAKSAPGWLVPALALFTLIAWERRWSELRRWELYAGFILQLAIIGPWLYAVTRTAHGEDALRALFWHNLVGRFTKIAAPAALDYTTGHRNSPGKYLRELPTYLLPWTLLAVAAATRAWSRVRANDRSGTAWRFAVASILPFLTLLSVAATARDVYAGPIMPGFALLIGLWAGDSSARSHLDRLAVRGTWVLVVLLAGALALTLCVFAAGASGPVRVVDVVTAVAIVVAIVILLRLAVLQGRRGQLPAAIASTCVAHVAALVLFALAAFPTIDRWQNLGGLALHIYVDAHNHELALLDPDETTIAMLDHGLATRFTILTTGTSDASVAVRSWLQTGGASPRILVKLPGSGRGELSSMLDAGRGHRSPDDDGIAAMLVNERAAAIVGRYELPHGRRYALLGPAASDNGARAYALAHGG